MTMNKRTVGTLILALLLASCAKQRADEAPSASAGASVESDEERTEAIATEKESADERAEAKAVPVAALVRSNNQFALDILKHVDSGSVAYSPYAVSLAGLMLQTGAEGATRDELRSTLRVEIDEDVVDSKVKTLRESVVVADKRGFQPGVDAQLWLDDDIAVRGDWAQRVSNTFGMNIETADMSEPNATRTRIDETVAAATVSRIENITRGYSLGSQKVAVTLAATPSGAWQIPFERARTAEAIFTNVDGSKGRRAVMRGGGRFAYWEDGKMQVVALPYEGNATAIVVLPRDGTFGSVESELSQYPRLEFILGAMRNKQVDITLPKFEVRTSLDLVKVFESMGAASAFGEEPGFEPAMGPDSTAVDLIAHETLFSLDEDGTRAQARSAQSDRSGEGAVQFEATRPFLVFVRDNATGQLLVVSRVM